MIIVFSEYCMNSGMDIVFSVNFIYKVEGLLCFKILFVQ